MKLKILQIDAFAEKVFQGNPAALCPLESWISEEWMQNIAFENNLSETVFFVPEGDMFRIRWFTPEQEVDLCGHATLATAHYLFDNGIVKGDVVRFQSLSGELAVFKKYDILYLDFPSRKPIRIEDTPKEILNSFSILPTEVWKSRDYLLVYENEKDLRELSYKAEIAKDLDTLGIIATCPGENFDFLSRFFAPAAGLYEDPVTGSSHCSLIPFWSERLGKKNLNAYQASRRGGKLFCEDLGDRVRIGGTCVPYLEGWIEI
ncbi:PhzF family phenazine biosynthesis protein [Leptospira sp. 201903070]|jgi:predicted PhzF superfamily epimerase YddE/YHI9|uniref:PhzF family phenazine biosynthesis protein n=1 Tax=Leptospira ainlahdjerensis TaxID=2810033 RepID=A0ABS2UBH3_9LEPT|nr:PhzF family phenazine biosynthesis protein [Leptospira ainlahdjerensis]MBM9577524.1 PhzF family phenazine biosynthesis protein [Leptospira ainlahdjerensis]